MQRHPSLSLDHLSTLYGRASVVDIARDQVTRDLRVAYVCFQSWQCQIIRNRAYTANVNNIQATIALQELKEKLSPESQQAISRSQGRGRPLKRPHSELEQDGDEAVE